MENCELSGRLLKNYKKLKKYISQVPTNAFRLYEKDIPRYPYIIDLYDKVAIIYEKSQNHEKSDELWEKNSQKIKEILIRHFGIEKVFLKKRKIQLRNKKYSKLDYQSQEGFVKENVFSFLVNYTDYIDTGLFLDHRPLRQMLINKFHNKKCLNLFCYTGSISTYLALNNTVTSVDLSSKYIQWAKENFKHNKIQINRHSFHVGDCLSFLKECGKRYDLIILDPPSFSTSKKTETILDIQKDHEKYIDLCIKLLNDNGVIYFSTNLTSFSLSAQLEKKYSIKNISYQTIPIDFRNKKIHQCYEIKKGS